MLRTTIASVVWLCCYTVHAADWPAWRADASRTANSSDTIGSDLKLSWIRTLPALSPAWPASQTKIQFDAGYEPVCAGGLVLVGSNVDDSVRAFELKTGAEKWRFFTNGPVRFAPTIDHEKAFVVSDDGCLYCLDLKSGKQLWKFNGAPRNNRIIGNGRLVSMWVARGGVVVKDGVAYFSAGIWPSMGVFIYAVGTKTGEEIWSNSTTGTRYITHPHGADSFGSISPQGYLAISGDNLIVPGGRTLPGVFDLKTGKLRHFEFGGKGQGGYHVVAAGSFYTVGQDAIQTDDGKSLGRIPTDVVRDGQAIGDDGSTAVITSTVGKITKKVVTDRKGKKKTETKYEPTFRRKVTLKGPANIQLLAGNSLITTDKKKIAIYKFDASAKSLSPVWSHEFSANVSRVIAADGSLIVVTDDYRIHALASKVSQVVRHPVPADQSLEPNKRLALPVDALALATKVGGHAICLGSSTDSAINQLTHAGLDVIVVDDSVKRLERIRLQHSASAAQAPAAGRVAGLLADPGNAGLPPYLATIIVSENAPTEFSEQQLQAVFHSLRPYGGTWCVATADDEFAGRCRKSITDAKVTQAAGWTLIERPGALAGAGVWTHQYGDSSNSVVSRDSRVKAPFGMLWFGGPSNDRVLPRHGHGPSPQVAGGRLFIEGADMLRCVDVYNGRVWWERDLPGLGEYYDNTSHHPGAGEIGSNYVSLEAAVYVIHKGRLLALSATSGKTIREFQMDDNSNSNPTCGSLAVDGNFLITTSSPIVVPADKKDKDDKAKKDKDGKSKDDKTSPVLKSLAKLFQASQHSSTSKGLHVFNRHTGEKLWSLTSNFSFRHNAICAVNGLVYCIDGLSPDQAATLKRRGMSVDAKPRLLAINAQSGKVVWSTDKDVFGTFLNYSREHGVLVQAGSLYRDRAKDEVGEGMVVYKGDSGDVVWKNRKLKYDGPCLLWHDKIITNGGGGFSIELLTGKTTGWKYQRMYGCNTAIGSEHLLTFRSGAAGFYDLAADSGTGNLGGFRSSCTSNLVVADGVLNAPDYTRTCSCAYQLQTSLAFVHSPDSEQWTFGNTNYFKDDPSAVAYNFGSPGDRRDSEGVLWFDYPSVGGPGPKLAVKTEPAKPDQFLRHSLLVDPSNINWIGASGLVGVTKLEIQVPNTNSKKRYTVRLIFSEPDAKQPGERVFSVSLGDQRVLDNFDIAANSQQPRETLVRDFMDVAIDGQLTVTLTASTKEAPALSGISIVETK